MFFDGNELSIRNPASESPASEFLSALQLLDNEFEPRSVVDDTRYFHELRHVPLLTCSILAAQCEAKVLAFLEGITTKVNKGDPYDFMVDFMV